MQRPEMEALDLLESTLGELRATEVLFESRVRALLSEVASHSASAGVRDDAIRYVYWALREIDTNDIAEAFMGERKPHLLRGVIQSVATALKCDRCDTPVAATSRSDLDAKTRSARSGRERWAEGYRLVCGECERAIHEQRDHEWREEKRERAARVEAIVSMSVADYLTSAEWYAVKKWYAQFYAADCEVCATPSRDVDVYPRQAARQGYETSGDLVSLCPTCARLLKEQGIIGG